MKKRSYDIALLLVVLVLFSASLGVLHGRRAVVASSVSDRQVHVMLTRQDALDYLDPLLLAGNVDTVARIMHQFSNPVFFEVLDTLIDAQFKTLSNEQKIALVLAIIQHDKRRVNKPMLIARLAQDFADYPVFYNALSLYEGTVAPIQAWLKRTKNEKINETWRQKSLEKAVMEGDLRMLKLLHGHNIRPDKQQASDFLQYIATESDHVELIPFLIREWGADPNYSRDQKHTILIDAVESNNPKMVRELLKEGGKPNLILDPAVGSAKQISFSRGYTPIEHIIQEHSASPIQAAP